MISMTALVVSITIVVLTLAAGQLGPRLIRNFTEDRVTQAVLGTFVSTILYLLIVLRTLEGADRDAAPGLAVTAGTVLSAACLFVLLFYIDRLARSIVSDTIAMRVTTDVVERWSVTDPARRDAADRPEVPAWRDDEPSDPVAAPRDGYLQSVDTGRLVELAAASDLRIRLLVRPGQWLIADSPVARIAPPGRKSPRVDTDFARALVTGPRRTPVDDVEVDLQRLVEIALRALSPGINDPFTAIAAIDNLGSCLSVLFRRAPEPRVLRDASGVVRMVRPVSEWRDQVDVAFDPLRHAGAGHPAIARRLMETLGRLAGSARCDAQRRALRAQVDALGEGVAAASLPAKDRLAIEACHRDALERLRHADGA
jgi:uncharacterized membrane protein